MGSMKTILAKLHMETFVFYLDTPLTETLMQSIKHFSARLIDEYTLEIDIFKEQTLNAIFSFFSEAGLTVRSMRNKTNRLEELFIRLTSSKMVDHE